MSLEKTIVDLTEAIKENTAALANALGSLGPITTLQPVVTEKTETVAPEPEPAKKKAPAKKAAKKKASPKPKEEAPAEDEVDRAALLNKIVEYVKGVFTTAEDKGKSAKLKFAKFREGYGVESASEVPTDKLQEFYDGTVALLGGEE